MGALTYERRCAYCEGPFDTVSADRLYCSAECRRLADNERKRQRRADLHEANSFRIPDAWNIRDLGEDVTANALLDGWTAGCFPEDDLPVERRRTECVGCRFAKVPKRKADRKKKAQTDLLCRMCRDGVRLI